MWQWVNAHGRCIVYPAADVCIYTMVKAMVLYAEYPCVDSIYTMAWAFCIVLLFCLGNAKAYDWEMGKEESHVFRFVEA